MLLAFLCNYLKWTKIWKLLTFQFLHFTVYIYIKHIKVVLFVFNVNVRFQFWRGHLIIFMPDKYNVNIIWNDCVEMFSQISIFLQNITFNSMCYLLFICNYFKFTTISGWKLLTFSFFLSIYIYIIIFIFIHQGCIKLIKNDSKD